MPRVHELKAAKDYPEHGIKKGDTYYKWAFRYGGEHKSKTRPRPSQLTQSKMSAAYAAQEAMEDAIGEAACPQDIVDALSECAGSVREVADEYRSSLDDMGEALASGPTGQEMEEKADALEAYADELESAGSDIEGLDFTDYVDEDAQRDRAIAALEDKYEGEGEPPVPSDEAIEEWLEANPVTEFDDLTEGEQEAVMNEARELAEGPSLEV
jgi:hypothetical protein